VDEIKQLRGWLNIRPMEVNMTIRRLVLATAFGLATLASSYSSLRAEEVDQTLLRAIGNAKVT